VVWVYIHGVESLRKASRVLGIAIAGLVVKLSSATSELPANDLAASLLT
jgi:hypothetical protein